LLDFLLEDFFATFLPSFFEALRFSFFPRPAPLFLPPPDSLFTVAQARDSAYFFDTPFFS
jgi:hypothetical protein